MPLSERQVRDVAENFDEIADNAEKLGGDTFDELVGLRGTADEVNNISHKRTDYDGKMVIPLPDLYISEQRQAA